MLPINVALVSRTAQTDPADVSHVAAALQKQAAPGSSARSTSCSKAMRAMAADLEALLAPGGGYRARSASASSATSSRG